MWNVVDSCTHAQCISFIFLLCLSLSNFTLPLYWPSFSSVSFGLFEKLAHWTDLNSVALIMNILLPGDISGCFLNLVLVVLVGVVLLLLFLLKSLQLFSGLPIVSIDSSQSKIQEGGNLTFACHVTGSPTPKVKWQTENLHSSYSPEVVSNNFNLFSKVRLIKVNHTGLPLVDTASVFWSCLDCKPSSISQDWKKNKMLFRSRNCLNLQSDPPVV